MTDGFLFRTSRLKTVATQSNGDLKQDCRNQKGEREIAPPLPDFARNRSKVSFIKRPTPWTIKFVLKLLEPQDFLDLPTSLVSTYLSHCQPADYGQHYPFSFGGIWIFLVFVHPAF